jgi:hypothetical protein
MPLVCDAVHCRTKAPTYQWHLWPSSSLILPSRCWCQFLLNVDIYLINYTASYAKNATFTFKVIRSRVTTLYPVFCTDVKLD